MKQRRRRRGGPLSRGTHVEHPRRRREQSDAALLAQAQREAAAWQKQLAKERRTEDQR